MRDLLRRWLHLAPRERPDVVLDAVFDDGLLYLVLENLGNAHAHDICVQFDRSLPGVDGTRDVTTLELFRDLAFLPAGRRISVFLDSSSRFLAGTDVTEFVAQIRFQDGQGRHFRQRIRHNLSVYREFGYIRRTRG